MVSRCEMGLSAILEKINDSAQRYRSVKWAYRQNKYSLEITNIIHCYYLLCSMLTKHNQIQNHSSNHTQQKITENINKTIKLGKKNGNTTVFCITARCIRNIIS
jgi:hypothetical protein